MMKIKHFKWGENPQLILNYILENNVHKSYNVTITK